MGIASGEDASCQSREERDASNAVTKRFYGEDEQIGGTAYYATRDHLGSVRELTDTAGTIRARYDYELYGKRTANLVTANPVESSFGFTGHYEHAQSGLTLAPCRAYNSALGRWISRDPIGEEGGLNLYGYVGNGPVNRVDPIGRSPADVAKITTVSQGLMFQMTADGQRLGSWTNFVLEPIGLGGINGSIGNVIQAPRDFWDWLSGNPLRTYQQGSISCQAQAQNIEDRLKPFLKPGLLDDMWTPSQVSNSSGTHVWLQLTSSNPNDPVIKVDPFKGSVRTK